MAYICACKQVPTYCVSPVAVGYVKATAAHDSAPVAGRVMLKFAEAAVIQVLAKDDPQWWEVGQKVKHRGHCQVWFLMVESS